MRIKSKTLNGQDALLILFAVGLTLLLVVRDIMAINLSKFIFLAYIVLFLVIAKYETMICMLCFVFPLVCGLPGTYLMPVALVLLLIKKKRINAWQLGLIAFVAVMEFLACFWYPSIEIAPVIQYISFAGTMFFLLHDDTEINFLKCVKMFFWGSCILCVIIIITGIINAPSNWMELFADGHFRFGATHDDELEGMGLILNANALAYYSVAGLFCGVFIVEKTKGVLKRLVYLLAIVSCTISGILTVSRSWLLVVLLCLAIHLIGKLKSIKKMLVAILVLALVLAAVAIFMNKNPDLLQGFVTRFTADDLEGGNGRIETMQKYFVAFFESPRFVIMGMGVNHAIPTGIEFNMHNGTQQILVCYGIVGFMFFMAGLIRPVIIAQKRNKENKNFTRWIPLLAIVLFVQTIQFINPPMQMFPYIIGVFAIKACRKQQ